MISDNCDLSANFSFSNAETLLVSCFSWVSYFVLKILIKVLTRHTVTITIVTQSFKLDLSQTTYDELNNKYIQKASLSLTTL